MEYNPTSWLYDNCPSYPANFLYKITSNSPVLWQLLTHMSHDAQDNQTFAPATTISYRGLMHYMYRRSGDDSVAGDGDSLSLINTGIDPTGVLQPGQETTVHLFEWDPIGLTWDYMETYDLAARSQAIDLGPDLADEGFWRTVSSDTQLVVYQGNDSISQVFCCCGCGDNFGAFMADGVSGNVVTGVGTGSLYGITPGWAGNRMVIGNTGVLDASYRIYRYDPDNPVAVGNVPATLAGTSGKWTLVAVDGCPAGFANALNPQIYGNVLNNSAYTLWRVDLTQGGPIQSLFGANMFQGWSGGAVMHAANGAQVGSQYWLNQIPGGGGPCGPVTQVINVFAPKTGMAIRGQSEAGYSATYTTNGPDQCVAFMAISDLGSGKRNWQFNSLSGGGVIAQYIECKITEKGYTAPFLQTGVHYTIIAPAIAFTGQPFWITVVVLDSTQTTKSDYCGTTSFTATDPSAAIQSGAMGSYNYTWTSDQGAKCGGAPYNDGVKVFITVVLNALGVQTIVATDLADGSITGLASIMVVGADVKLSKTPRLSVQASGDTVQFRICWSNYSSASAFTFVITDAVPRGTTFVQEAGTASFDCGNTNGVTPVIGANSTASGTAPTTGWVNGNPAATSLWLRFTIPVIGVNTTGCVCYRVTVN